MLTEKFQEKIAKFELVGDQDSWGSALLKIKSMADGEITAIYSDVFGIDCKFYRSFFVSTLSVTDVKCESVVRWCRTFL